MKLNAVRFIVVMIIVFVLAVFGSTQNKNAFKGNSLTVCEHDKAWATSTLRGPKKNPFMYHESNIADGDIKTAWVEGEPGPGIGVKIIFEIPTPGYSATTLKNGASTMVVYNGLCLSKTLFLANNRVKDCLLEIFVGVDSGVYSDSCSEYKLKKFSEMKLKLQDTEKAQKIFLNIDHKKAKEFWRKTREQMKSKGEPVFTGEYGLYLFGVLTINSVYKGSRYDDTCISEISFE